MRRPAKLETSRVNLVPAYMVKGVRSGGRATRVGAPFGGTFEVPAVAKSRIALLGCGMTGVKTPTECRNETPTRLALSDVEGE